MKKIGVRLVGGLGNQLHCYAIGRALAVHNNVELEVDAESGFWNDPYQRQYLLDAFPFLNVRKKKSLSGNIARLAFKVGLKLGKAVCRILPHSLRLIVEEAYPRRYQEVVHRTSYLVNPYLIGNWASYRYYDDIVQELRRELTPPKPVDASALNLLREIESQESCSIHWRAYLDEPGVFHPSLTGYYQQAINLIVVKYPDVRFFVFSDDPVAARGKLPNIESNSDFVDIPNSKGNVQSLIDFYLMYACDHKIIGDSTFSWWAAWLGSQENKTIIAPDGLSPWGIDWVPAHWEKILFDI